MNGASPDDGAKLAVQLFEIASAYLQSIGVDVEKDTIEVGRLLAGIGMGLIATDYMVDDATDRNGRWLAVQKEAVTLARAALQTTEQR